MLYKDIKFFSSSFFFNFMFGRIAQLDCIYFPYTPFLKKKKKKKLEESKDEKKKIFMKNRKMKRDNSGITDAFIPSVATATIYISIGPYLTQYYFYIMIGLLVVVVISVELWTHYNRSYDHDDVVTIRKRSYQLRRHWRLEERRRRSHSLTPSIEVLTTRREKRHDCNGIKNTFKRRAKSFRDKYFHKYCSSSP